jgi:tripartite-type tricarboxylate transporter receptor subunit TctC
MGAVPTASSPAETDEFVRSEIAKYKEVVKKAGIQKK